MSWRWLAYMSVAGSLSVAVLGVMACPVRAQQGVMDAWANFILAPKVWKGQVVAEPDPGRRVAEGVWLESRELPLRVHARRGVSGAKLRATLAALEQAYRTLSSQGWPLPFADGGFGGSLAFDLYLDSGAKHAAYAELDSPIAWVDFDSAQTYAVVDEALARSELPACVMSAFVQAALRGQDPSEAQSLLRATGDFAAYLFLGEYGCAESMLDAQAAPELGFLQREPGADGFGALFFAMLSERHDAATGKFVAALWELTRQRSLGLVKPGVLRSSPDVWEALAAALHSAGETWNDDVEEFVAARLFAGEPRGRKAASYRVFAALPDGARVPMLADWAYAELPKRFESEGDGLAPLGSRYLRVRTAGVTEGQELRIWLRGELGPRWSLIAIRRAADGSEVGRVKAPQRTVPDSFLPVLLTQDTAEVVVVVTHMTAKVPDADIVIRPHGFEILADRSAVAPSP